MASRFRPTVVVSLVYASTAVVWASYSLLSVVLPFRFQSLGLSVVQYGLAIAVFALGMLVTETVWGLVAFRIGNLRTILALGLVVLALYLGIGMATSFLALAISLGLFGALIIYPVPLFRWMAMIAGGPGTEGTGTGRYGLFFGGGMVIGATLGPFLYATIGFAALVVVVIATYATGLALMAFLPWQQARLPRAEHGSVSLIRRVLTIPFLLASLLAVIAYLALTLVINFLQLYSIASFHGTQADAGYVIGLARATLLVAGFLLGGTVDRFRPLRSVPFGFLLIALGAFGTLFSTNYPEMIGATVMLATGMGWLSASLLPMALTGMPVTLQGTAVGVFGSFEDLGLLIGPIVISGAYAAYGVNSMFLLVGLVALGGAFLAGIIWLGHWGPWRDPNPAGR
ncbi:MAG TPA: MFS transporter [Thermoplasmata archaeon]|nr:MFS transporter [Thermoplasmata archaeon]